MSTLSIIIPAYNEVYTVKTVIDQCHQLLTSEKIIFEIIIINDGSDDGSEEIIFSYREKANFTVVNHQKNLGFGQALKSGILVAKNNWILIVPSDGQFPIKEIVKIWNAREENYIICGVRENRSDSIYRKTISKLYNLFISYYFRIEVLDIGWIKLYQRKFLSNLEITTTGFIIDTEIMHAAALAGFKTKNILVEHSERKFGSSKIKISSYKNILNDLIKIIKLKNERM